MEYRNFQIVIFLIEPHCSSTEIYAAEKLISKEGVPIFLISRWSTWAVFSALYSWLMYILLPVCENHLHT